MYAKTVLNGINQLKANNATPIRLQGFLQYDHIYNTYKGGGFNDFHLQMSAFQLLRSGSNIK